jgi:hypothetical protein
MAPSLPSAGSAQVDEKQRLTLTRKTFLGSNQADCAKTAVDGHWHMLDMLKKDLAHNQAEKKKLEYAVLVPCWDARGGSMYDRCMWGGRAVTDWRTAMTAWI